MTPQPAIIGEGTGRPLVPALTQPWMANQSVPRWLVRVAGVLAARPIVALMLAAALIVGLVETLLGYHIIRQHGLVDPDNYMRLVRIRDGLSSGWFAHIVTADNAGKGTLVYWSHFIDAVVLLLRLPLRLVLGGEDALFVAGCITAPLVAALLAAVLVWAPAPLVQHRWLWTAPVAALFSPAIRTYGTLGNVHHHLPLALMALLTAGCAGRAVMGHTRPAVWCGICAAIAIWISPEALPYVLMPMGAIGLAWCLRPTDMGGAVTACGTAFAAATAAATLCDPPYGGWLSPEIDCISIVYAALAVLICGASWALVRFGRHAPSVWARCLCCILAGTAVVAFWLALCPSLTHGLGGLVPEADADAFFGAIAEMRHMAFSPRDIGWLIAPTLAVLVAAGLAVQTRSALWAYAAACGVVVLALAAWYIRFLVYAETMTAVMLPFAMQVASAPRRSASGQSMTRVAVLAAFFLVPLLPTLAWAGKGRPIDAMGKCLVADIAPVLLQQRNAVVLTEVSDTPEILWRTPVRTVGSFYHRSIGAFIRARNAWRTGPSANVPQAVLATGATHILACDLAGRTPLVSDLPKSTLEDRLARHDVPPWLREVGHAGGYSLYRIDRADVPPAR